MIYLWLACAGSPSKTAPPAIVIVGGGAAGLAVAKPSAIQAFRLPS